MRWMLQLLILTWVGLVGRPVQAACDTVLPQSGAVGAPARRVKAADLIQLRDVGDPESSSFNIPSPFGVAPDGHRVAFYVTRADLATNRICRALVLLDLAAPARARVLDQGGETILADDSKYGVLVKPGVAEIVTPLWSSDGRRIVYRRRDGDATRAWIVEVGGAGAAHPVTPANLDVDRVSWTANGAGLIYAARPGLGALRAAIEREGRAGWLYDARIWPNHGPRPQLPDTAPITYTVLDLGSGEQRAATPAETAGLQSAEDFAETPVAHRGPRQADTSLIAPSPFSDRRVKVSAPGRPDLSCMDPQCTGRIITMAWAGRALLFLRREGWNHETTALYSWRPGARSARRRWSTLDVLHGCRPTALGWICTRENSRTPRSVVLLEPLTGQSRVALDLNPEFAAIKLPEVRRLRWRNDIGLEAWGDLVLPPDYRPGQRVPLVIIQYRSVGFLRGGIGNEYPIFLFAERGMAVLSFERPPMTLTLAPTLADVKSMIAFMQRNWGERRSLLSSLEMGIELAVEEGVADPKRIGITGLSDGATTVSFALINGRQYAAAASSTCCLDPDTVTTYGGIGWSDFMQQTGYPPATRPDPGFWAPMSIAQNARSITTPLLLQSADSEYLLALQSYEALRELKRPVELYVFPNELHDKVEPAHRAAVFDRSLDWFDFWLRGRESADPAKAAQYCRWEFLRAQRDTSPSSTP